MAWTITVDQGFNETYYLNAKAAQMGNGATAATALQAIQAAGMTAAQHYSLYGYKEGLAPNAYFSYSQYSNSKAAQMGNGATAATFELAWLQSSGSTNVYQHYAQYGAFETGVEPSSGFNDDQYYTAKAAQMGGTTTPAQAKAAIQAAGLNPISHYALYGKNESLNFTATPVDNPGQTFTLTTGADQALGSLITGAQFLSGGVFVDTLNNFDTITGTAGTTDKLTADLSGTTTTTPTTVAGIEVISITNTNRGTAGVSQLDLANGDASITTVNSASNANDLTITNIGSAPTTFSLSTTASNFTANILASKLSGTADATTMTLNNVTAGTITLAPTAAGSGYETVSLVSSGTVKNGNTTDLVLDDGVGTSLTTVNVSGTQNLDLDFTPTTITTVNAGTMTGKFDVDFIDGNARNVSVLGGTNNDIIELGATAGDYNTSDTVNGGLGTDTLRMINADATNATATQSNVSNIEVIGLTSGISGAVDLTKFGATGLQYGAASAANSTITYAAGLTNTLDFQNFALTHTLSATVNGTATTDVMGLTLGTTAAASGNNSGALTFVGAETLNILSQGGANTLTSLTLTNTASSEKVVVTGGSTLTLQTTTIADSIDASGMTGSAQLIMGGNTNTLSMSITGTANTDTLIGGTVADIIIGGAGNDTIHNVAAGTAAAAGDIITGGTGNDVLVVRSSVASEAVSTGYGKAANITDFTVGTTAAATDTLELTKTTTDYGASAIYQAKGDTTIQNVAQNAAVTGITGNLVKLTTGVATTGLTVQQAFNTAIGTATVDGYTALDDVFVTYYDTTNSKMAIGMVDVGANTTLATADVIKLVGTVDMSAADYANFSSTNFTLIA